MAVWSQKVGEYALVEESPGSFKVIGPDGVPLKWDDVSGTKQEKLSLVNYGNGMQVIGMSGEQNRHEDKLVQNLPPQVASAIMGRFDAIKAEGDQFKAKSKEALNRANEIARRLVDDGGQYTALDRKSMEEEVANLLPLIQKSNSNNDTERPIDALLRRWENDEVAPDSAKVRREGLSQMGAQAAPTETVGAYDQMSRAIHPNSLSQKTARREFRQDAIRNTALIVGGAAALSAATAGSAGAATAGSAGTGTTATTYAVGAKPAAGLVATGGGGGAVAGGGAALAANAASTASTVAPAAGNATFGGTILNGARALGGAIMENPGSAAGAAIGAYGMYQQGQAAQTAADAAKSSTDAQLEISRQQTQMMQAKWDEYQKVYAPLEAELAASTFSKNGTKTPTRLGSDSSAYSGPRFGASGGRSLPAQNGGMNVPSNLTGGKATIYGDAQAPGNDAAVFSKVALPTNAPAYNKVATPTNAPAYSKVAKPTDTRYGDPRYGLDKKEQMAYGNDPRVKSAANMAGNDVRAVSDANKGAFTRSLSRYGGVSAGKIASTLGAMDIAGAANTAAARTRSGTEAARFYENQDFSRNQFFDDRDFSRNQYFDERNYDRTRYADETNYNRDTYADQTKYDRTRYADETNYNRANYADQTKYDRSRYADATNYDRARYANETNYGRATYADERDYGRNQYFDERDWNRNLYLDERDYQRDSADFARKLDVLQVGRGIQAGASSDAAAASSSLASNASANAGMAGAYGAGAGNAAELLVRSLGDYNNRKQA